LNGGIAAAKHDACLFEAAHGLHQAGDSDCVSELDWWRALLPQCEWGAARITAGFVKLLEARPLGLLSRSSKMINLAHGVIKKRSFMDNSI
jgi:hypothetical protein